ncbi:MAG: DUF6747 family protein [Bacteroidota bacterium]
MRQLLLFKEAYREAFKNLGHYIVRNSFKVYFWACAALFVIALYAFAYRLSTGFIWD